MYFAFHYYGVEGIIYLKIALAAAESLILFHMAMRYLNLSLLAPITACWRPALAAGGMVLAVNHLTPGLSAIPFVLLIFKAGIGALTYASVTWSLWLLAGKPKGMESMLADIIRSRLSRPQPGAQ